MHVICNDNEKVYEVKREQSKYYLDMNGDIYEFSKHNEYHDGQIVYHNDINVRIKEVMDTYNQKFDHEIENLYHDARKELSRLMEKCNIEELKCNKKNNSIIINSENEKSTSTIVYSISNGMFTNINSSVLINDYLIEYNLEIKHGK